MKTILFYYAITAAIYMAISVILSYKSFKKASKTNPDIKNTFNMLKSFSDPLKNIKILGFRVVNWFTISVVGIPMFFVFAQFAFPFSFLGALKRIVIRIKIFMITGKFSFNTGFDDDEMKVELPKQKPDYRNNSSRIRMRK